MTTGSRWICFALSALVLSAALNPITTRSDYDAGPQPDSIFQVDVPFWMKGDEWTYDTHLHLEMGLNETDLIGTTTYTVTGMFNVTQNGTYHEAYNVSVAGSFTGSGRAYFSGLQATITVTSATLVGFQWFDRADLSLIRDNESIVASGTVTILIFTFPMSLGFSTESNRSPSQEDYDFPLLSGDNWQFYGNMRSLGFYSYSVTGTPWGDFIGVVPFDHNTTMDFDARLEDEVDIDVGGTPYHCYHINETSLVPSARGGDTHIWYSPAAKNYVRERLVASTVDYILVAFSNLTTLSLGTPPYQVPMMLDPQVLNPGGYLNATGKVASVPALVTLFTPWNGSSSTKWADLSGNFSFLIRAPTSDDNTPCNADIGSFGVIVEVFDFAGGFSVNTSTIVLQMPDLSVRSSDLGFASPPRVGIQTTIMAVAHESPLVGVYNTVSVDFLVDGSFLASDSVLFMLSGGQHTFTATWTPTIGIHTIGVRIDPGNNITESDESNNYAEITASTLLPDLVPWNITLSDGGIARYTDPGSFGFVSAWVDANLSETLDISYSVRNVGNLSHNGILRVIAVETQGLFGPPTAIPFYIWILNGSINPSEELIAPPATWPVPALPGASYYINLTIDSENSVMESHEDNNTFAIRISVGAPDLLLTTVVPAKIHVGGTGNATILAQNWGDRDSPATILEVRNYTSGALLDTIAVPSLAQGGNVPLLYDVSPLAAAVGSYCLSFHIDPVNTIQEYIESNNLAISCFNVTALPETTLSLTGPLYNGPTETFIRSTTDISFAAVDYSGTGINRTEYRIDGGSWVRYVAGTNVHLFGDGAHTVQFNSTDNVSGSEPTNVRTLVVDDTAPDSDANWDGSAVSIGATDTGSGVASTYYNLDSTTFLLYSSPFAVTAIGQHTVLFYSVDRLQNTEQQKSYSFTISSPPETTLALEGPVYVSPLNSTFIKSSTNITFDVVDHSGSGTNTAFRVDGGGWIPYLAGTKVHLSGDGPHIIQFNSTDNLGGVEQTKQKTLVVDDTAPVSTASWNGSAVVIGATDGAGSGVASTYYRIDSGSLTLYTGPINVTSAGSHVVVYYSIDRLQNVETQRSIHFNVSAGGGGAGPTGENLKPFIAATFAFVLLAVFLFLWREDRRRNLLILALTFIVAEILTGGASTVVDPLVYSPSQDKALGLYIDLVILILGTAVLWVTHKSAEQKVEEKEPEEKS